MWVITFAVFYGFLLRSHVFILVVGFVVARLCDTLNPLDAGSIYTSHKKVFRMKTSACRDGTLKNQPNKMGTTPQYIYTIPISCAILPTMLCVCYLCA